jgi:hypothetical protein
MRISLTSESSLKEKPAIASGFFASLEELHCTHPDAVMDLLWRMPDGNWK